MKSRQNPWAGIPNLIVRGRMVSARIMVAGKPVWRALHVVADPAGKNRAVALEALRTFKLELARDHFAILALTKSRNEHSTFAALFAAYRTACEARNIAAATVERNILDMQLLVRSVHGKTFSVEAARINLCTEQLLIDFRAARMTALKRRAAAEKWTPELYARKLHSTRVTIKSTIHHARSLFAQTVLQERAYRELTLPSPIELTKFMKFRPGGGTTREFEMPDAAVLERLRDGATLFRSTRKDLWFALVLTANFGMRRKSALHARWSWFRTLPAGGATAHVRVAKRNLSRVGVSTATWAEMQRLRPPQGDEDYILPGDDAARDALLTELAQWLRQIGFDEARCPVHELRGLFVNAMTAEHSLTDATAAVGHSTEKTTRASYLARGTDKAVDVIS